MGQKRMDNQDTLTTPDAQDKDDDQQNTHTKTTTHKNTNNKC